MSMKTTLSQAVIRATDATLVADNWQRIMEVCDLVKEDPEDNGKYVVQFLERRFEQRDANVILRAISLTIALAENCGSRLQQEISSKHFTHMLYELIENKHVHHSLKIAIAKCVEQLAKSFKTDPSLKSMNDTYRNILKKHSDLLRSSNGLDHSGNDYINTNMGPSKPSKLDKVTMKEQEDKELEEVMKLSLQEYERAKEQAQQQQQQNNIPIKMATKSQLKRVKAMYDLSSKENDELSFHKGDIIVVLEQVYRDWWRGSLQGKIGIFPINYVVPVEEEELDNSGRDNIMENKIFNNKDKVDQLHYTLKSSKDNVSIIQDDSINKLYGEVTPMRPEITKLIGKYAKDREELGSLHQLLANAEATYNDIMKRATNTYASMGQQQQQQQQLPIQVPYNYPPQYPNISQQPTYNATGPQPGYNTTGNQSTYNTTGNQSTYNTTGSQPQHNQIPLQQPVYQPPQFQAPTAPLSQQQQQQQQYQQQYHQQQYEQPPPSY